MKGIPPEIDGLMWSVAENGSSQAIDEFATRYPNYRLELMRRCRMVAGLKSAAPHGAGKKEAASIPKFTPKIVPTASPWTPVTIGLSVAALAFLLIAVVFLTRPRPADTSPDETLVVNQAQPAPIDPTAPVHTQTLPGSRREEPSSSNQNPGTNSVPGNALQPSEPTPLPKYLQPKNVSIKGSRLTVALDLITAGSGITLEIAPGFEDPEVDIDYHDKSTIDILNDLSRQYAFTLMEEGKNHYLAVPASDSMPERRTTP